MATDLSIHLSIPPEWKAQPPALVDAALQADPARVHVARVRDPLAVLIGRNLSTHPYGSVEAHADALARLVRDHITHEGATS